MCWYIVALAVVLQIQSYFAFLFINPLPVNLEQVNSGEITLSHLLNFFQSVHLL